MAIRETYFIFLSDHRGIVIMITDEIDRFSGKPLLMYNIYIISKRLFDSRDL